MPTTADDGTRREALAALAMMLDYAIVAGAELRLARLVLLIRIARNELPNDPMADLE